MFPYLSKGLDNAIMQLHKYIYNAYTLAKKMETQEIEVNGNKYFLNIYYQKVNRCSANISNRSINIRISTYLNREQRVKELLKLKSWVVNKLQDIKVEPKKQYQDLDTLEVGDRKYMLNINYKDKETSSAKISNNIINLQISSKIPKHHQDTHISKLIGRCIARSNITRIKERTHHINKLHFNKDINRITLKNNISNWGSCSRNNNINLSTRILFAPQDVQDYVIIHELAHLIEHNHSERFWSLVEKAMPDYKEKKKWLKENRGKCEI